MPSPRCIQSITYNIANRSLEIDALKKAYERKTEEVKNGIPGSTVISLYGISGTGKTSVLNAFNSNVKPNYIYLDIKEITDEVQIMEMIWANLVTKYNYKFIKFEWALYKYRLSYNPTGDNRSDMSSILKRSRFLQNFKDILKNIPTVNVVIGVAEGIANMANLGRNYLISLKSDIQEMDDLEPSALKRRLSMYLASDIEENLTKDNQPLIIELDSSESIIKPSFRGSHENWLMNLPSGVGNDDYNGITVLTPHVVWLFAGREKITWDKQNEDWNDGSIKHIPLDPFTFGQTCEYLKDNRISEEYYRPIYTSTNGNPEHINYCINLIASKKNSGDSISASDLSKGIESILKEYISYFSDSELKALFMLMILSRWTEEDIKFVKDKWDYVDTLTYSTLKDYSFIRERDYGDFSVMEFDSSFRKVLRNLSLFGHYKDLAEEMIDETLSDVFDYYLESVFSSDDRFALLNHLRIKSLLDGITLIHDSDLVEEIIDEYFLESLQWEMSTSNPMDTLDVLVEFTSSFSEMFPLESDSLSELHHFMMIQLFMVGQFMTQLMTSRMAVKTFMNNANKPALEGISKTQTYIQELFAAFSDKELESYRDYLQELYDRSDLYAPLRKTIITVLLSSIYELLGNNEKTRELAVEYAENLNQIKEEESNISTDMFLEVTTFIHKKQQNPDLEINLPENYIDAVVKTSVPFFVSMSEMSEEDTELGYHELLEKIDVGLYCDDDVKDILSGVLEEDSEVLKGGINPRELSIQELVDLTSDEDGFILIKSMEAGFQLVIYTLFYTGHLEDLTRYLRALSRCFVLERLELIEEHTSFVITPIVGIYSKCKADGILDEQLAEVIQYLVNNYVDRVYWNSDDIDEELLPDVYKSLAECCHLVDLKENRDMLLDESLDTVKKQFGGTSVEYAYEVFNDLFYDFEEDVSEPLELYHMCLEQYSDFSLNPTRMLIMIDIAAQYPECRQLLRDMSNKTIADYDPNSLMTQLLIARTKDLGL